MDNDFTKALDMVSFLAQKVVALEQEIDRSSEDYGILRVEADQSLEDLGALRSENEQLCSDLEYKTDEYNTLVKSFEETITKLNKYIQHDPVLVSTAKNYLYGLQDGFDRMGVIKEVRAMTGWGLKFSKDFVDKWIADGATPLPQSFTMPDDEDTTADKFVNDVEAFFNETDCNGCCDECSHHEERVDDDLMPPDFNP